MSEPPLMHPILKNIAPWFYTNRMDVYWIVGFMALATILCGLMLNPTMTVVNHDAAIFALLAQSLAEGQGYFLRVSPTPEPYFTFPPGFALQLALIMKILGTTHIAAILGCLKAVVHGWFIVSIPLFYLWTRHHFGQKLAIVSTALLSISPLVYKYSSDLLSDVPYWGMSMAALFAHWRWSVADAQKAPSRWRWLVALLALVMASILTRQIGIALALAMLLYTLTVYGIRQQRWILTSILSLVLLGSMAAWPTYEHYYRSTHHVQLDTLNQADVDTVLKDSPVKLEYIKHFSVANPVSQDDSHVMEGPADYLQLIQTRVREYGEATVDQLVPPIWIKTGSVKQNASGWLYPLVLLLAVVGIVSFYRRAPLTGVYITLFLGVLAVYPYYSPRFVVSLMPFMLLLIFLGAHTILKTIPQPKIRQAIIATLLGIIMFGGHLPETVRWVKAGYRLKHTDGVPSLRAHNTAFYEVNQWLKAHVPADALILSRKPPVTYYFSGRHSVGFLFTADEPRLLKFILDKREMYKGQHPDFYVIDDGAFSESKKFLTPLIQHHPELFQRVYIHPTFTDCQIWKLI